MDHLNGVEHLGQLGIFLSQKFPFHIRRHLLKYKLRLSACELHNLFSTILILIVK